ncbi:MAG TPA: shikimate dehydrogenase [Polyangiaceae bacterium]|jgi:shikimate dehydrogenase|nr:shikimate dehydrogenase [Polyangiaceae bacterium]
MTVAKQRFVLIGHPVLHSLSPAIHQAAYDALGLPHRYELVDCPDEAAVERVVAELRAGKIAGANVTIPWKRAALKLADRVAPGAQRVAVANVLARGEGGAIVAHNTDVPALVEEFQRLSSSVRRAVVIGNGGAAPAVVSALQDAGAERIALTARRFDSKEPESNWPHGADFAAQGASLLAWPESDPAAARRFRETLARVDVIVQCTSAGMHGADDGEQLARIVPWEHVPQSALAYDLIYNPATTPFLTHARQAGLEAENGLGMLVAQAALAIKLWLNLTPPRAALEHAALAALAERTTREHAEGHA